MGLGPLKAGPRDAATALAVALALVFAAVTVGRHPALVVCAEAVELPWSSALPLPLPAPECSTDDVVEVAIAIDVTAADIAGPLVRSAVAHSAEPRCLRFHALAPRHVALDVAEALWATLAFHRLIDRTDSIGPLDDGVWPPWPLKGGSQVRIVPFDTAALERSIKVVGATHEDAAICRGLEGCNPARARRLQRPTNFARFFLAWLLPELPKVLWLDCDVVVRQDLGLIWRASLPSTTPEDTLLAAFPEPAPLGRFYFSGDTVRDLWRQRHGGDLELQAASFNDGVIAVDLAKWRRQNVSEEVEWWMERHRAADPALWKFGTQPIMLLVGAGRWQQLPSHWYLGDLGFRRAHEVKDSEVSAAAVLHFDGEHKPWLPAAVSPTNSRDHGVAASWNSRLLQEFTPEAPAGWLGAPGARCLHRRPMSSQLGGDVQRLGRRCVMGPFVPGVSVPGLMWRPAAPELFNTTIPESSLKSDALNEGFFSAKPLSQLAASVLEPARFAASAGLIEFFFLRPQLLTGAYWQAASPDLPVRGARLQYRLSAEPAEWRESCSRLEPCRCDPRRGPSLSAGASEACWKASECEGVMSRHWRVVGWTVEGSEHIFGSVWLDVAEQTRFFRPSE